MITKFFYELTKRNWGAPYHLILAWFGVNIAELFLTVLGAIILVVSLSVIYEIYQMITDDGNTSRDSIEDLIADLIGIILGVIF